MKTNTAITGGPYVDRLNIKTRTPARQKRQELRIQLDVLVDVGQGDSDKAKER